MIEYLIRSRKYDTTLQSPKISFEVFYLAKSLSTG
jgi:hypothetical protein